MTRPRQKNDGLPHRVYERRGLRTYSIGYKGKDGTWIFRESCPINDERGIKKLRQTATKRALMLTSSGSELETIEQLSKDWFAWQYDMPAKSPSKRASSTLAENEREAKTLLKVFAEHLITEIRPFHAYMYLEQCEKLGRGPKGNKEVQLLQSMLQRAMRKGIIDANPLRDVERLPTAPSTRYVEDDELKLALDVGQACGGQLHRASLALGVGYLCLRRSTEVLDADWSIVTPEGLEWTEGKTKNSQAKKKVLISWSDELRNIIDSLMALDGYTVQPSSGLLFKTQDGQRYTRGGWKATLRRLMAACEEEAKKRNVTFKKFSLQDLRPKGVTDKLDDGHTDVQDATLHRSGRMIQAVYDRRKKVTASPAR